MKASLVAMVLVALCSMVLLPVRAATSLSDYNVYGERGVFIGGNSTVNGLVGARTNDPVNGNAIKLNGGAGINGDARSGANVNLQNNAFITGTLYMTSTAVLKTNSGDFIGAVVRGNPMLPIFPGFVTRLVCPTGGASTNVPNDSQVTLLPGNYGTVQLGGSVTLVLYGSGNYYFDAIHAGNGTQIIPTQLPVSVYVCDDATFGSVQVIVPTNTCPADFFVEVHSTDFENAFRTGNATWTGNIFAPFGGIHVGGSGCCSTFTGELIGLHVDIEHAVTITNRPCVSNECACIDSFTPTCGLPGTVVTINGHGLNNVTQVRFSPSCDPTTGVPAQIVGARTDTQIKVLVPPAPVGNFHIRAITPTGSFCTSDLFFTGPCGPQ